MDVRHRRIETIEFASCEERISFGPNLFDAERKTWGSSPSVALSMALAAAAVMNEAEEGTVSDENQAQVCLIVRVKRKDRACVVDSAGFPPHLESLEKQGQTWKSWKNRLVWGQKPGKILQNLEKILTSP